MKTKLLRPLIISLVVCTLVGCKRKNNKADVEEKIPESGINLVENNSTEYRILYEMDGPSCTLFAANELQTFIDLSSGVTIPTTQDTGEEFNAQTKVISLGNTNIFKTSGLEITDDMLNTGYYLKRMENTLIINAKDGNGVANAVYDMLNYTIDLEIYADDEIDYKKTDRVPLLDFDIKHIPYIDVRDVLMKSLTTQYRRRMKLFTGEGMGQWVSFAHTVISRYLPRSTYYADHPDWYNSTGTQVCYSNEAMRHEMAKRIEADIASHPDGKFVMIGHEDNFDMCNCNKCVAERSLYGGYGGQELHFTNLIAEEVDAWLKDNIPGREVVYVFFAYQISALPPVKTEVVNGVEKPILDSNGNYQPIVDFKIRNNVAVFYCPIDADFSKPFDQNNNGTQYEQLKGWSDIFHNYGLYSNILIWSYSLSVRNYMLPFNNFGVVQDAYDFYQKLGACYVMEQCNHDSGIPCFSSLRIYTYSKLLYKPNLDYNKLVDDFARHYYKEAANEFLEYFYFIRALYSQKNVSGSIWASLETTELWSLPTLEYIMSIFDRAFAAIEPLRQSDYQRFTLLNDRLRRERMTPIFLLFRLYMSFLTQEQKEEYIDDFAFYANKYEIIQTGEAENNLEGIIQEWKSSIYN